MSSSNKVKIPGWTFAASFQAFLTTCTVGHWKEVSTENGSEHYHLDCPSVQKLQAWGQDMEAMGQEAVVLHSSVALRGFTSTADSQDQHCQKGKGSGLNQTGLFLLKYMLQISPLSLSIEF